MNNENILNEEEIRELKNSIAVIGEMMQGVMAQIFAMAPRQAKYYADLRDELLNQGFSRGEALYLIQNTKDMMTKMVDGAGKK